MPLGELPRLHLWQALLLAPFTAGLSILYYIYQDSDDLS